MASLKGKGQLPFHSNLQWALAMAMAAFHCFSGPFSDLLLSGFKGLFYESQLSPKAKLLIANDVRIGGLGGVAQNMDNFEAIMHLIAVVDFEADVPGGNWVTVGYRFLPGARLWGCKGGRNEGGGRRVRIGVPGRGV